MTMTPPNKTILNQCNLFLNLVIKSVDFIQLRSVYTITQRTSSFLSKHFRSSLNDRRRHYCILLKTTIENQVKNVSSN